MKGFKFNPISFQKKKHKTEQKKSDKRYHQVIKDQRDQEIDQITHQKIKKQLENLPRFTYKTTRFYRHKDELQSTIDKLVNNSIVNLSSKTLTENYVEEIYDRYMLIPGEVRKIMKSAIVGGIIGAGTGLFHAAGIIALPLLNPLAAGGASVSGVFGLFLGAVLCGSFTAILQLFRPLKSVEPGFHMLTVYGDLEDKKKINAILDDSVTISI
jgi:hypothetical protein